MTGIYWYTNLCKTLESSLTKLVPINIPPYHAADAMGCSYKVFCSVRDISVKEVFFWAYDC